MHVLSRNRAEMPAAPGAPASALPADANRSGAARPLLLLSLQPPSWELPCALGSSPPVGSPQGSPRSPTLKGTPRSVSSRSVWGKTSQQGRCHQAITLQRKKLFHPSRKTSSQEPPAKCLYQGAGEEERGGGAGSGSPSLEWGTCSNLFSALRPAEREKSLCFSMNWYNLSSSQAYLGSITVRRPDPTGGTGHPAPGLRGFHL